MPSDVDPEGERRALEEARAALYRPGADERTRRAYEDLAARLEGARTTGADAAGSTARPAARRRRVAVAAAAAAVLAAVLGCVVLLPRPGEVRMTSLRIVGATDPVAQEAAVLSLFAGSFAAQNKLALRAAVDAPPALAGGDVQGAAVRQIDGTAALVVPRAAGSGTATVVVLCTSATAYRWELSTTDAGRTRVLATSSAADCLGTAAYATVRMDVPRRAVLRFVAEHHEQALVALVVVPDEPVQKVVP